MTPGGPRQRLSSLPSTVRSVPPWGPFLYSFRNGSVLYLFFINQNWSFAPRSVVLQLRPLRLRSQSQASRPAHSESQPVATSQSATPPTPSVRISADFCFSFLSFCFFYYYFFKAGGNWYLLQVESFSFFMFHLCPPILKNFCPKMV